MEDKRRRGSSPVQVMIIVAIVGIAVGFSLYWIRSKMTANENAAREALHAYNLALWEYFTIYETYPKTLVNLGAGPETGVASAGLLDAALASGRKSGYVFAYVPGELDFDGTTSSFNITAKPSVAGFTGRLNFSMDQTGVVRISRKPAIVLNTATP